MFVLLTAALAAGPLAAPARADGDPASDYLLGNQVFYPFDAKFPARRQAEFSGVVRAANDAGFTIRVAFISTRYDMGSITTLYRRPRTYARFLGQELGFVYKQRLLVVMPNGFGFSWQHHPAAAENALLARIPVGPGTAGMLTAAETAVQRLAAADGVKVTRPAHVTTPGRRNSRDRLLIIAASVAGLVLVAAARLALRRRRS